MQPAQESDTDLLMQLCIPIFRSQCKLCIEKSVKCLIVPCLGDRISAKAPTAVTCEPLTPLNYAGHSVDSPILVSLGLISPLTPPQTEALPYQREYKGHESRRDTNTTHKTRTQSHSEFLFAMFNCITPPKGKKEIFMTFSCSLKIRVWAILLKQVGKLTREGPLFVHGADTFLSRFPYLQTETDQSKFVLCNLDWNALSTSCCPHPKTYPSLSPPGWLGKCCPKGVGGLNGGSWIASLKVWHYWKSHPHPCSTDPKIWPEQWQPFQKWGLASGCTLNSWI